MVTVKYAEQLADALARLDRTEQVAAMEMIRSLGSATITSDGHYVLYGGLVWVTIQIHGDEILVTNAGVSVAGMM